MKSSFRAIRRADGDHRVITGSVFEIEPRTGPASPICSRSEFQGSQTSKGQFDNIIYNSGGATPFYRFDYTNYEVVTLTAPKPSCGLSRRMLMRYRQTGPNQQGVVANEVKVNVINQPYGGWPWLDMPQVANENWHNAHNFYGDLADLEAATVEDSKQFFNSFYRPNNAVLVVAGDIDYAQTRSMIDRLFAGVPGGAAVQKPDIAEPRQTSKNQDQAMPGARPHSPRLHFP